MEEFGNSIPLLLKQVKMLTQQHLMLSEALAFANERIAKLEKKVGISQESTCEKETKYAHMKIIKKE